jgi:hypothetical protein
VETIVGINLKAAATARIIEQVVAAFFVHKGIPEEAKVKGRKKLYA